MRQSAGVGFRVSAHTDRSPVATAEAGAGRRIRAAIPAWPAGASDAMVAGRGGYGGP
jgi:hypothetical protein